MNNFSYKFILLCILFFVMFPTLIFANCTCSPTGGSILQGIEYIAKSCPEDGDNSNTKKTYISQWIVCENGKITKNSVFPSSEGPLTIEQIISKANSYNTTKILRNESGTHFIAVHRYYQGTVAGVTPSVGVTTHANLNEYCTGTGGLIDADQDKFPYCLDCNDADPNQSVDCPFCAECNLGPNCPVSK